jgi:hypothetical protein
MSDSRPVTADAVPDTPIASANAQRVSYIFVGKPGVGKSHLAEKLSASIASVLVTPERVLQESLGTETAPSPEIEKV